LRRHRSGRRGASGLYVHHDDDYAGQGGLWAEREEFVWDIIYYIIVGIPSAIGVLATTVGVVNLVKQANVWLIDRRERKWLKKYPYGPGEQKFFVKSTSIKYMMAEDSSEVTKVRELKALKDVDKIKIDRAPAYQDPKFFRKEDPSQVHQECFAMPGVALKRGDYYLIDLGPDQIFKAKRDHAYLINYKLRLPLDKLFSNPNEDGIHIEQPLGDEKLIVEVHFPPTRKLKKVNNKLHLKVLELRDSQESEIDINDVKRCSLNTQEPIDTKEGIFTDMFRLTLHHPPRDANITIMWPWYRVDPAATRTNR
jgi:hypothetical protein